MYFEISPLSSFYIFDRNQLNLQITVVQSGRIQNMVPGAWTTSLGLVHGGKHHKGVNITLKKCSQRWVALNFAVESTVK